MNANPDSQQWSVHAEFTISHPGIDDPNTVPQTHSQRDENGVRMVYQWPPCTLPSHPGYGFQRGNMTFTSTPPPSRPSSLQEPSCNKFQDQTGRFHQDSGYNSELFSPNSAAPSTSTVPAFNRRCRSTCSITLSTIIKDSNQPSCNNSQCNRTHSLRCQTPSVRSSKTPTSFFGCGDPWCYHSPQTGGCSTRCSPVKETVEESRPSRSSTFRSSSSPPRLLNDNKSKDVSVQTFDMVDKCTSPMSSFYFKDSDSATSSKEDRGLKKRLYNSKRRTEPIYLRHHSPHLFTPDSLENVEVGMRMIYVWTLGGVGVRSKNNALPSTQK